jgi:dihydrofolate synthase/folylpolyglutamate synthase
LKRTYVETVDYLFSLLPVFQRDGAAAYKPGLETTLRLCEAVGNPQNNFKSIHIGGTNGKGSSSHTLASILQEEGYKTGLYTSPHLIDFRERIRINGIKIPEKTIVELVDSWSSLITDLKPSFFELTVALAFWYFSEEKVDIAVIEVGMGGRLDSTNVITPVASLITNIGLDHQAFLGDTIEKIATEKAGIIKPKIPVIVSERRNDSDFVFLQKSNLEKSGIEFASDKVTIEDLGLKNGFRHIIAKLENGESFNLSMSLAGIYQLKNIKGILWTCKVLNENGFQIGKKSIEEGISKVQENTSLMGRWQTLMHNPTIVCDTGHNEDGIKEIVSQLSTCSFQNLWLIWGMVSDKDHGKILNLLPKTAKIIATQPHINRALPVEKMTELFINHGFLTFQKNNVSEAIDFALKNASTNDLILIGGSTFTVAEIPFEKFNISF